MKNLWNVLFHIAKDESGQGMVEYVLIIALIAVALIVGIGLFKDQIAAFFTSTGSKIQSATPSSGT